MPNTVQGDGSQGSDISQDQVGINTVGKPQPMDSVPSWIDFTVRYKRPIREVLQALAKGETVPAITKLYGISRSAIFGYKHRAEQAGLRWPLPEGLSDLDLEAKLFPSVANDPRAIVFKSPRKDDHAEGKTLSDLLSKLCDMQRQFPTQWRTAMQISECLKLPLNQIPVIMLQIVDDSLRPFLALGMNEKYVDQSLSCVHRLRREAEALGWIHPIELPAEWKQVLLTLPKTRGQNTLIKYVVEKGMMPKTLSDSDLMGLRLQILKAGKSDPYSKEVISSFKAGIRESNLQSAFPELTLNSFFFGVKDFPETLSGDLEKYFVSRRNNNRSRKLKRIAPASEREIRTTISQLYGYARDEYSKAVPDAKPINSLRELLSRDLIKNFIDWHIEKRKRVDGDPFHAKMSFLYSSFRYYSDLANHDLTWFPIELDTIPRSDKALKKDRADRKEISFSRLLQLPAMLEEKFNHNL